MPDQPREELNAWLCGKSTSATSPHLWEDFCPFYISVKPITHQYSSMNRLSKNTPVETNTEQNPERQKNWLLILKTSPKIFKNNCGGKGCHSTHSSMSFSLLYLLQKWRSTSSMYFFFLPKNTEKLKYLLQANHFLQTHSHFEWIKTFSNSSWSKRTNSFLTGNKKIKAQKGGRSQEAESQRHTKRQYNRCTRVRVLAGASF